MKKAEMLDLINERLDSRFDSLKELISENKLTPGHIALLSTKCQVYELIRLLNEHLKPRAPNYKFFMVIDGKMTSLEVVQTTTGPAETLVVVRPEE